jgi:hypothetical protein
MERLKFWQRRNPAQRPDAPAITRFNIQPRTDVGPAGLPDNPNLAARLTALRRQRESILAEVAEAEEAFADDNRWRMEAGLIDQALAEIETDLLELGRQLSSPGQPLPATPVTEIAVDSEPVAQVRFWIGDASFAYAEEIDWAERGTQIARSELIRQSGDVSALIPVGLSTEERAALTEHLEQSLFAFVSDVRDRALAAEALPAATLADLAKPSAEFGGWLDWLGNSPIHQRMEIERNRLEAEHARLSGEREALVKDQERKAELLPIARRRLAEIDRRIEATTAGN